MARNDDAEEEFESEDDNTFDLDEGQDEEGPQFESDTEEYLEARIKVLEEALTRIIAVVDAGAGADDYAEECRTIAISVMDPEALPG